MLLIAAVLAAGVGVSITAEAAVRRSEQRYAGQVMDRYAEDVSAALTDEVDRYGQTLSDLAAAVAAQPNLTAIAFTRMTQELSAKRLPGAGGVAFVVPTTTKDLAAVQAIWRSRGDTGLLLAPYGTTAEHNFVIFERLFDGGTTNLGLDLNRIPQASTAMHTARDGGMFAVSPAYILLRDRGLPAVEQQTSVVLAAPIHDDTHTAAKRLAGWIVMAVRGSDFLTQSLHLSSQGVIGVTLTDPTGQGTVIARATPGTALPDDTLIRENTLTVGQRRWQLTVSPTTRLLTTTDRRMSELVLGAGLAGTLLLTALVGVLAGSRNRAMDKVDRATAALREDIERRQNLEHRLREREIELQELAFHDPLTGLGNRILFYERVGHALLTHARNGQTFAVYFIDLDGFKEVNDRLGHAAGDTVLRQVAERITTCLRASDTAARFGGDEFAVIAERLTHPDDAHTTAERIVHALAEPYDLAGHPAAVTASVGIALNQPGDSADDILREADLAMYTAKTSGKNRYSHA